MSDHTVAEVSSLPDCDFCKRIGRSTPAAYDGATRFGPWAFMCLYHFNSFGVGLGLGRGQRLLVEMEHND